MLYSLMTEPQIGGTYDELLDLARWAERRGMVSFSRSDHYYSSRSPAPDATDAFATVAGMARDTSSIRLTILVSPITFRHPAVIAKMAATIDQMSGGRLDLGVGTGWMDLEHEAFGIPFPPRSERFARLEEAVGYLTAAFAGQSFSGSYYTLTADARPRPTGTRIVIGGSGAERTPRLAGRFADEYNHFITDPEALRPKIARVRAAADEAGRDPATIEITLMGQIVTGADAHDAAERIGRMAAARDATTAEMTERLERAGIPHGPPARVAERIAALEAEGVSRIHLQWLDLQDREGLEATAAALGI